MQNRTSGLACQMRNGTCNAGRAGERGFTLLEAIVALTIMGLALVPLATFVSQSADQLERVAASNERSIAMRSAIAILDPVNPYATPQGETTIGDEITVSWTSTQIIPPADRPQLGSGLPAFRVGFYDVKVSLMRDGSTPWFDFDLRKIGYQRISTNPFARSSSLQ
jgi:prepilin-type N-terminal cleavage/methylation domain-containing protein